MQDLTPKETALSVVVRRHSCSPSTTLESTPTPKVESKSFRKLFCASLELEPAVAAPAPASQKTTTASNAGADGTNININNYKDAGTQTENTQRTSPQDAGTQTENTQPMSLEDVGAQTENIQSTSLAVPRESIDNSRAPKTLKDSRWANDDEKIDCEPKALKWSRWAGHNKDSAPRRTNVDKKPHEQNTTKYTCKKPHEQNTTNYTYKKPHERNTTRHTYKKPNNAQWAKNEEKEETPKPRLVNFDWEEFHREVRENNLKTLKDSRWA